MGSSSQAGFAVGVGAGRAFEVGFKVPARGVRVLRGDYLRITEAAASLGAKRIPIVSMANDVIDGASAETIGAGLRCLLDRFPGSSVVHGGAASVWGYANQAYDDILLRECSNLDWVLRNYAVALSAIPSVIFA